MISTSSTRNTRNSMQAGLRTLEKAMHDEEVFLQYTGMLETLSVKASAGLEESTMQKVIKMTELLTETVQHHTQPQTECCFVTLLEVMASYCSDWKLSSELESVWKGLGYTVDPSIPEQNYRNMACNMLLSLPWVPDTQDLHWICQVEEIDSEDDSMTPLPVLQSLFNQISSAPLHRRDSVNRLVNRLLGHSPVTVAISSREDDAGSQGAAPHTRRGLGKTTLAAMVASTSTIQEHFCVLWLPFRDNEWDPVELTYHRYTRYLDLLCEQLSVKPEWPLPHDELEPPSLRLKREEERLLQAKRKMANILSNKGKNILVVIDRVKDDREMEWFRFSKEQNLLVTAETLDLSVDWTLELDVLSEKEALDLFLTESGCSTTHSVLSTSQEAKYTVQCCGFHPLIIRTVARWFRLMEVTSGVTRALEELNQELKMCSNESNSSTSILGEIMDKMLSPVLTTAGQPTKLMKLCLSSMATVFSNTKVPTEVVHLLWEYLLRTEPNAREELGDKVNPSQLKKRVRIISEALISLGFISLTEQSDSSCLEIHHDMYVECALLLPKKVKFMRQSSQEQIVLRWNQALAKEYLSRRKSSESHVLDHTCREYASEKLLWHMLQADMWQEVVMLLKDEKFFRDRLVNRGRLDGTKLHLEDCRKLKRRMNISSITEDHSEVLHSILLSIYLKLAAVSGARIGGTIEDCDEIAKSLHCVGFMLSENGHLSEAITCYKAALKVLPKRCVLSSEILHSLGTVYLAEQNPELCLKTSYESLMILDGLDPRSSELHSLRGLILQTRGDAMAVVHDYRGAMDSYNFSFDKFNKDSASNRVDLGKLLFRKGILYQRMGELEGAMRSFQICIKWKSELGETSGEIAVAYSRLGDIHLAKDATPDALLCFKRAALLMEEAANEVDKVDMYTAAGKISEINGFYQRCRDSFSSALSCLSSAPYNRMKSIHGSYHVCSIARTFMKHDDDEIAHSALDQCLEYMQSDLDSLDFANIIYCKGEHCLKQGKKNAISFFEQSLQIRINKLGWNECVIENVKIIGEIEKSNGELVNAEKHYQLALRQAKNLYGDENENVTAVLYDIGELKISMKEYAEALEVLSECLDIQRRTLGSAHPTVANTLCSIGTVFTAQHRYDMAYKCCTAALEIRRESYPIGHSILAETLHALGFVARKRGDIDCALQFLQYALDIRNDLDDKMQICETLAEFGHVQRLLDNPKSAANSYETCIEVLSQEFGDKEELIGDIYLSLGHTKKRVVGHLEAIECFQRALDILVTIHGKEHHKVATALRSLGITQFQLGNPDEAIRCLDACVKIAEATQETDSIEYILVLQVIGDIYELKKSFAEARLAWSAAQQALLRNNHLAQQYRELGENLTVRLSSTRPEMACPSFYLVRKLLDGFNRLYAARNTGTASDHQDEEDTDNVHDVVKQATFMEPYVEYKSLHRRQS